MPKTGWCRECGAWVEPGEDGGCPEGHDAECVDAVHTPGGTSAASQGVGVGPMPDSFNRFGWGAYFLMPVWGVVYGSSAVLGWWMLSLFSTLLIVSFVGEATDVSTLAAVSSLSSVVQIAIHLWVGMNAYRWLWKREQLRLEVVPDATPRYSVAAFMAKQVRWLVAGAVLTVLSVGGLALLLSGDATAVATREQFGISRVEVTASAVWTFAEVVFAVWLAQRMRRDETESDALGPAA